MPLALGDLAQAVDEVERLAEVLEAVLLLEVVLVRPSSSRTGAGRTACAAPRPSALLLRRVYRSSSSSSLISLTSRFAVGAVSRGPRAPGLQPLCREGVAPSLPQFLPERRRFSPAREEIDEGTLRISPAPARIPRDEPRPPPAGHRRARRLGPPLPQRLRVRDLLWHVSRKFPVAPLQAAVAALRHRPGADAGRALLGRRDGGRAQGRRLSRRRRGRRRSRRAPSAGPASGWRSVCARSRRRTARPPAAGRWR